MHYNLSALKEQEEEAHIQIIFYMPSQFSLERNF